MKSTPGLGCCVSAMIQRVHGGSSLPVRDSTGMCVSRDEMMRSAADAGVKEVRTPGDVDQQRRHAHHADLSQQTDWPAGWQQHLHNDDLSVSSRTLKLNSVNQSNQSINQ